MGFLILSRRIGEKVMVGDQEFVLASCSFQNGYAKMRDFIGRIYHLHVGQKVILMPNVTVQLCAISGRQCKLGFEAPQEVKIVREELLK